jgi:hypothetical protein
MSTPTRTQTRAPERFVKDPERHYLRVQKDGVSWEGTLEDYLGMESPTKPGEDMYRQESDDRKVTGDRRMVLLSCSKADYEAHQAQADAKAKFGQAQVESDETFVTGNVLTI